MSSGLNGWEKVIATVSLPALWLASLELRIRGIDSKKVDKEMCKEITKNIKDDIREIKVDVKAILHKLP